MEDGASDPDFDANELDAIFAVWACKGQAPFQPQRGSNRDKCSVPTNRHKNSLISSRTNSNGSQSGSCCRHSNPFGHLQKDCHKRRNYGAEMVDAQEKPFNPKVSVVQETQIVNHLI
jgi:hypothetical protein